MIVGYCILISSSAFSQKPEDSDCLMNAYYSIANKIISSYKCCTTCDNNITKKNKMVLKRSLDTLFLPIFSTVVLDNNSLIQNGTAGSISQDADKGTISINYASSNFKKTRFYNYGVFTQNSGSFIQFFSSSSWNTGVGLNLGLTQILPKNGQYFEQDDCEKLAYERKNIAAKLLLKYRQIINLDTADLLKRIDTIDNLLDITHKPVDAFFGSNINFNYMDSIRRVYKDQLDEYTRLDDYAKAQENLESDISEFEVKKKPFTGYWVHWVQFNLGYSNNTNKLYDSSILTSPFIGILKKDYNRFRLSTSYNLTKNKSKSLSFFTLGLALFNTNFLENKTIKDIPFIKSVNNELKINSPDGTVIGDFKDLTSNLWVFNPSIYVSSFFTKNKNFGFGFRADWKNVFVKPLSINYVNTFSSSLAFLFRVNADDALSKATIGLEAGFFDANVDTHVWKDFFSARVSIGVPFRAFFNK